ncbi:MFS transporter [Actinopolymorpha pittospori]|uniref:MFS family permease n=1 Tax=Actinopolymorpha pittospori TaxID=648752 RepID=A0A927RFH4_9ACTN|nr:MFS transporter [Actinopolymorpha pittospori]MBE1603211.1 MFS family permease [Actinopolymorpha pittospori]
MGSALNPINSSLIATALAPIALSFHVSVGRTAVLLVSLYLASAIAQPTAGKIAEEFGPRRTFLTGATLVLIGGVLGSLSQNIPTLVVSRVLIGIGTSAGYPTAMLMIRRRAAAAHLQAPPGSVLGALSIAGQATLALGLPIGGILVGTAGWRATFLINIPVTLVTLAMTLAWIPRDGAVHHRGLRDIVTRIDVAGILGFGGAMAALLVFLLSLPDVNWVALVVAVVLAVALVNWELRAAAPFLDVRLLASNLALTRTYLRQGLTQLGVYTVMYGVTQWLEAGRGVSAEQAGLLVLPMSALAVLVTRPIARRNLVREALIVSALSFMAGSAGMLFLGVDAPVIAIVAVTLVFGITVGTTSIGNQTALYTQVPITRVGTASGLFRTFGYVGSIASSTLTGIVFKDNVTDRGLHSIALVLIAVSVVVLVMVLTDRALRNPLRSTVGDDRRPTELNQPQGEAT